jgi:hypothetical protein
VDWVDPGPVASEAVQERFELLEGLLPASLRRVGAETVCFDVVNALMLS